MASNRGYHAIRLNRRAQRGEELADAYNPPSCEPCELDRHSDCEGEGCKCPCMTNMAKQESLELKDKPIRIPADSQKGRPVESSDPVHAAGGAPAPISTQEQPMPSTNGAIVPEIQEKAIEQQFAGSSADLQLRVNDLKVKIQKTLEQRKDIRPGLISEAQEVKELGDSLRARFEKSEWPENIRVLDRLHKRLTGLRAFYYRPADEADSLLNRISIAFKQQEIRKANEERRRLEAEQQADAEKDRAAQVKQLEAEGRVEEAQIAKEQPLPPPVAPPAKEVGKIAGISVMPAATLGSIKDPAKLVAWLARNPSQLNVLFDVKPGAWKQFLSAHLDKKSLELSLDPEEMGIEIEMTGGARKTGKHDGAEQS